MGDTGFEPVAAGHVMPQKSLTIGAINEQLKAAKIGIPVYARDARQEKLSSRAVLPPKPGSKATTALATVSQPERLR
jgi:hypothetical protein